MGPSKKMKEKKACRTPSPLKKKKSDPLVYYTRIEINHILRQQPPTVRRHRSDIIISSFVHFFSGTRTGSPTQILDRFFHGKTITSFELQSHSHIIIITTFTPSFHSHSSQTSSSSQGREEHRSTRERALGSGLVLAHPVVLLERSMSNNASNSVLLCLMRAFISIPSFTSQHEDQHQEKFCFQSSFVLQTWSVLCFIFRFPGVLEKSFVFYPPLLFVYFALSCQKQVKRRVTRYRYPLPVPCHACATQSPRRWKYLN